MKNVKMYESFLNEGYIYGKFSKEDVSRKGLKNVITGDFFLDLWFDSYFKNTSGDSSYDYRRDDDFWMHTDEILDPDTDQEREILRNPTIADSYHDSHWATVLSYIDLNKPNPFSSDAGDYALQNVIKDALSDFNSSRRRR